MNFKQFILEDLNNNMDNKLAALKHYSDLKKQRAPLIQQYKKDVENFYDVYYKLKKLQKNPVLMSYLQELEIKMRSADEQGVSDDSWGTPEEVEFLNLYYELADRSFKFHKIR